MQTANNSIEVQSSSKNTLVCPFGDGYAYGYWSTKEFVREHALLDGRKHLYGISVDGLEQIVICSSQTTLSDCALDFADDPGQFKGGDVIFYRIGTFDEVDDAKLLLTDFFKAYQTTFEDSYTSFSQCCFEAELLDFALSNTPIGDFEVNGWTQNDCDRCIEARKRIAN